MVLVDNTVLSNFAKVGRLHLLERAFDEICITSQVLEEFKFGIERGVLTLCVKRGVLSREQGDEVLKDMILKGFYSPVESLDEVM